MDATILAGGIVILLFSVIIHEVMHGVAALYFGDHTAERAGRLTLNPIPHIDPIGTLLIPALFILPSLLAGVGPGFIIGWAKPVPVNPFNFRDIRKGELFTAAAGVLANFILAVLAALVIRLGLVSFSPSIQALLSFTVNINLLLAIFNSLPVPPLDGSKVIISFLPTKLAAQFQSLERYGIFILLFLLFFPIGGGTLLGFILSIFLAFFHSILGV